MMIHSAEAQRSLTVAAPMSSLRRRELRCLAVLIAWSMLFFVGPITKAQENKAKSRPNILVILADDLGYGDLQCYNPERGKIPTPNLDRLASRGMRFTDGHSSSGVCSPSRYTLLTGHYHWRTRLKKGIVGVFEQPLIAPDRLTIAGLAKRYGYQTACIGKWHLGWDWPIEDADRKYLSDANAKQAKSKGATATAEQAAAWKKIFSRIIAGGPTTRGFDRYFGTDVPNWPPFCFIENDRTVGFPSVFLPEDQFRNHLASKQGPALENWNLERILPTLGDRAAEFVSVAAKQPEPFLLYVPLTAPHTPIAVSAAWQGKSGLGEPVADFIMQTDSVVGQVLEALEESGEAENTLVLFSSDNGFAPYVGAERLEARGHYPSGPLRGYKASVWEGGHRVPFIVRWPSKVRAGGTCGQLVHHADLIATLAEVWGERLADDVGEDSFSMLPLLKGNDAPIREHAVSCASNGTRGLRVGSWKLIVSDEPQVKAPAQLYNLADDLGETKDLAGEQPDRVAEMKRLLDKLVADGRSRPAESR